MVKASAYNVGDPGSIPESGGSPGEGNGSPLQSHSCLENPMDRGAWWTAVRGVAKNRTRLSDFTFTFLSLEAYTNHWTNLRRTETKRKKEFNLEGWEKETSNTIS